METLPSTSCPVLNMPVNANTSPSIQNFLGAVLPFPEFPEVVQHLNRKRKALDLGCGEGENALVLAELGFTTTAVDPSKQRVLRLQRVARQQDLPLRAVVGDPHSYCVRGMYDLILAQDWLRCGSPKDSCSLVRTLQSCTRKGGFNVLIVRTAGVGMVDSGTSYIDSPADLYKEWKVIVRQSYTIEDTMVDDASRPQVINRIIAQRPS